MKRITVILIYVFCLNFTFSQENILLDRDFWKEKPALETVINKIKDGSDPTELNQFAFDPISWALIEKADNDIVKYLLTFKDNGVNKLTHDGRTYIFWAAYKNNIDMMQYLVDKGAKTDIVDDHGYSLLNFAATTGQLNSKLYDFCIAHGANVLIEKNHDGANALLLLAPHLKDITLINYFVSKGIDINSVDNNSNGIFCYATKNGNINLLKTLIDLGVSHDNNNAVIFASQGTRGHTNKKPVYEFLESIDLKINTIDSENNNPLHALSYRNKDLELLSFFIDKGVDVNKPNNDGNTPFMNASYLNSLEVIKKFPQTISDINLKNKDGQTALSRALQRNNADVVAYLIEKGADTNVKDKDGNNLNYYLFKSFSTKKMEDFNKKVKMLQEKGLSLLENQANGNTLLHLAIEANDVDRIKYAISKEVDINIKNNEGLAALHLAAMKSKDDSILKLLISNGANTNIKTDFDESVYDLAKENELLIKNDVDINFLK